MKLRELLRQLDDVRKLIDVPPVFICGGAARDKFMGRLNNIVDLDLTNGSSTINYLSQEFAIQLRKRYNVSRKTMDDGHSTIFIGSLKMDFSSAFVVPGVDRLLERKGIKPTNLLREMYSRDFTCNSLLMTLDLKRILDPTHQGFKDIREKKIRTCLAPEITLTSNRNRVARAIYLACKLGFEVDESIITYVRKNPQTVKISTEKSMTEKLNDAFSKDAEKASRLITQMGLWNYIPISEVAFPYYRQHLKGTNHAK